MKKISLLFLILILVATASAQVVNNIGTNNPSTGEFDSDQEDSSDVVLSSLISTCKSELRCRQIDESWLIFSRNVGSEHSSEVWYPGSGWITFEAAYSSEEIEDEIEDEVEAERSDLDDVELISYGGTCDDSYSPRSTSDIPKLDLMPMEHLAIVTKFNQRDIDKLNFDKITILDIFDNNFEVVSGQLIVDDDLTVGSSVDKIKNLINIAKTENPNIKIIMSFSGKSSSRANFIIKDSDAKNIFFDKINSAMQIYDLDGISLDLEHPNNEGPYAVTKEDYVNFLLELRRIYPQKIINVYGPKSFSGRSYDIPRVFEIVDYFSIMSYGIHRTRSSSTGPYTPLRGAAPFVERWSLEGYLERYNAEINSNLHHKLILGISPVSVKFGGVTSLDPRSDFNEQLSNYPYSSSSKEIARGKRVCLHPSGVKFYNYIDEGTNYQVWFEDYDTYHLKFNWLLHSNQQNKLGGFFDWTTSWVGNDYWSAMYDNFKE
jgi:hypothetical protein